MNTELIESITKMILEKLAETQATTLLEETETEGSAPKIPEKTVTSGMVKFWDHLASSPQYTLTGNRLTSYTETNSTNQGGMVKLWDHVGTSKTENAISRQAAGSIRDLKQPEPCNVIGPAMQKDDTRQLDGMLVIEDGILAELQTHIAVNAPCKPDALLEWVKKTPARVGIGRAGLRPKTETWLRFRLDHGAAVDAVYGSVPTILLESLNLFSVNTMVDHKEEYIRRPDLGRKLSEEAKVKIRERCQFQPQVQIIASDGLSSQAIEKNLEDVYLSFLQSLDRLGIQYGTPFYIEKGRVASMDEVGEILQPEVVVLFIGERPGLVSSESLSAYLCYKPRKGTIEAERMVISNIHSGGIPPVEAGAYLGGLVQKILKYQASGVSLIRKEE